MGSRPVNAEAKVMQLSPDHTLAIFHTQTCALTRRHVHGIEKQSDKNQLFSKADQIKQP